MKLDHKLNLVVPVDTETGTFHVHSTPISRETFEQYFLVIAQTFTQIYKKGLDFFSGPRIAYMMLKSVAESEGQWEGPSGVENGLMSEIRRLTNVIMPSEQGNKVVPFQTVINQKLLTEADISEVENILVFFIVTCAMNKRDQVPGILASMALLWQAETTSLNCTAWQNSLPKLTETDSSSETIPQSRPPF